MLVIVINVMSFVPLFVTQLYYELLIGVVAVGMSTLDSRQMTPRSRRPAVVVAAADE